jgi:small subunit ribosomal protein S20
MANHPSAERRNRQRIKRTARNRTVKSAVRSQVKKARVAIATKPAEALELTRQVESALDKAARKGIIHRKSASRAKSRLHKRLHAASKAPS